MCYLHKILNKDGMSGDGISLDLGGMPKGVKLC